MAARLPGRHTKHVLSEGGAGRGGAGGVWRTSSRPHRFQGHRHQAAVWEGHGQVWVGGEAGVGGRSAVLGSQEGLVNLGQ